MSCILIEVQSCLIRLYCIKYHYNANNFVEVPEFNIVYQFNILK